MNCQMGPSLNGHCPQPCMSNKFLSRLQLEQGGLAITAAIILVGVAVLGYAMSWMQLRGTDIAYELSRKKTPMEMADDLIQDGVEKLIDSFGDENASCDLPADIVLPDNDEYDQFKRSFELLSEVDKIFQVKVAWIRANIDQPEDFEKTRQVVCSPGGGGGGQGGDS